MLDKVQNHAMQVKKSSDIVILSIKAVMMSWAREVATEVTPLNLLVSFHNAKFIE